MSEVPLQPPVDRGAATCPTRRRWREHCNSATLNPHVTRDPLQRKPPPPRRTSALKNSREQRRQARLSPTIYMPSGGYRGTSLIRNSTPP